MMMLMLRYINGENMKHWKLGIVAALLTGAAYAAPLPVVTSNTNFALRIFLMSPLVMW